MLRNDSCGGGGEKGWARLFLGPRDAPPNAMQVTGRLPHRPRVPAPDTRPRTRFSSETPWPAAIKLAREPIPFRATSLTTPVRSLSRLRLRLSLSSCHRPLRLLFPSLFFSARSSLIHSTFAVGRLVLAPSTSYSFLSVSCVFASTRLAYFRPKPSTRSLPSDRSQRRPSPLSSPSTCCPRSRSSLVFLRSFKISSCNYIRQPRIPPRPFSRRALLPPPPLDSTDRFSPPLAFFTTVFGRFDSSF